MARRGERPDLSPAQQFLLLKNSRVSAHDISRWPPHKKAPVLYYRHDLDIWLAQYSVVTSPEIFNVKAKK